MIVLMVAFWAFLAWAVVASVRSASRTSPTGESADEILAARDARGEIDTERFERRRDVLRTAHD